MNSFFVTAPRGVTGLLADELRALGCEGVKEHPAGVDFSGDLAQAYGVCLWSRTGGRVLLPLAKFSAATAEALYDGVQAIDWSQHMDAEGSLAIDFTTVHSALRHTQFGAQKVKDAIVDQFRARCGRRPDVDTVSPDLRLHVHVQRDEATVAIDLAGDSLHKRGYRLESVTAPLKENLAAALLLRAGWPEIAARGGALVDPMCGSGTLLIEAALLAGDIAPGLLRAGFGFQRWKGHRDELWQPLLAEARRRREAGVARIPSIVGSDQDRQAVVAARANVAAAGLGDFIKIERRSVAQLAAPEGMTPGLLIVNPPYGERLGEVEALAELYAQLGAVLKQHFVGWQAAVFTGNLDLAKRMGLRARRLHPFYNGALECTLLRFDVQPEFFVDLAARRLPTLPPDKLGPGAAMFANRLRKNLRELGRWAQKNDVDCYRLYDADMPEYALAVDLYHDTDGKRWVHAQEYAAPASVDPAKVRQRLREAVTMLPEVLEVPHERIFLKVRERQKGTQQYERLGEEGRFHEVRENGCLFWVNFSDYLDTGLFLDHRLTRARVGELARDRDFLNLFAYTGSATVYAAKGGARTTTTVDMSNTYLDWARANLELNGIEVGGGRHRLLQADCLAWLAEQGRHTRPRRYGVIFLDPPTFSTSKRMTGTLDIQRDHIRLIQQAMALLERDGVLIFSNNFRKFHIGAAAMPQFLIEDITAATLPRDFAGNPRIHHCFHITHA